MSLTRYDCMGACDVPKEVVMGYPAKPIRQFWREIAALSRLIKRDKSL